MNNNDVLLIVLFGKEISSVGLVTDVETKITHDWGIINDNISHASVVLVRTTNLINRKNSLVEGTLLGVFSTLDIDIFNFKLSMTVLKHITVVFAIIIFIAVTLLASVRIAFRSTRATVTSIATIAVSTSTSFFIAIRIVLNLFLFFTVNGNILFVLRCLNFILLLKLNVLKVLRALTNLHSNNSRLATMLLVIDNWVFAVVSEETFNEWHLSGLLISVVIS